MITTNPPQRRLPTIPPRDASQSHDEPGSAARPLLRDEGLPFADVLTEPSIRDALNEHGVKYRDRVFDPVTTIWGFLSQVLSDDHSCRDAVTRIIAHRAANGLGTCSPNTTSYCNARGRLPTGVLRTLARRTAEELQAAAREEWKWNGRDVFIADGSHVSMPDTPENQAAYPQPPTQQPGVGFPLARVAVLLSLATGACHDLAIAHTRARGPARPPCCGRCTARSSPATCSWPTRCSTTTSWCASCAAAGSMSSPAPSTSAWAARCCGAGPRRDPPLAAAQQAARDDGGNTASTRRVLVMRQVTVDARDKENRAERFDVVTTILDASIDGGQIGDLEAQESRNGS